ncbi:MAG: nuclease, partial [Leptolyngbyaceae cyanobacterium CRU_2_3]|nr:nuclease [Leptolyngbyaceae cyanobacterium CRU_2_3]
RPCFDYVALGHVHRHQILSEQPYIVYPGSIERVDFSEEKEEKGFILAKVEPGNTRIEFCSLPVRKFHTINIDISTADQPQKALLKAIESAPIEDAVVRLLYQLRADQLPLIESSGLHQALQSAHTYTIQAELISQTTRSRSPELGTGSSIDPMAALKTYLIHQPHLADIADEMLKTAQSLLTSDPDESIDFAEPELRELVMDLPKVGIRSEEVAQLRLL